jgi:DNA repair exonuclease SbcCD nuclease subunit
LAFRFVHAADIHLDSPLRSLALRDPALAELIGGATRRALVNVVDLCLEEQVDALLLAGDLYDGDQTSMKTARFFADQMHRLDQAGTKVFIVKGNHDAASKITKQLTLPENVHVFGGRAEFVEIEPACGAPVAIHGLSFAEPKAPASLLPRFKPPVAGAVNIGVMHTSLSGSEGHDDYAPCSVAELQASGFRYWALGHIHKRSVVSGSCTVVMPGNPQGRDINEAGPKSATLVTIGDDGSVEIAERLTSIAEFARLTLPVEGCDDWASLVAAMRSAIETARDAARSEHLVLRLGLSGATPLAWRLRADAELLRSEADAFAARAGAKNTWIEKIEVGCTAPAAGKATPDAANPLAELMNTIESEVLSSDAFVLETGEIAQELLKALPPECRASFGADEAAFKAEVSRLAREGVEDVMARLRSPDGSEAR